MTREQTKKAIEVMQAFVDGKTIIADSEVSNKTYDVENPIWNWCDDINTYRVKPQPKYVPYDDVSEVQREKWVMYKNGNYLYPITCVDIKEKIIRIGNAWYTLQEVFDDFEYEDGTPCGKGGE